MTNPERFTQTPDQLPSVSRKALEAFEARPHDFKADFGALLRENPVLARAIAVSVEDDKMSAEQRLAFAHGALWMYTILNEALDVQRTLELVGDLDLSDGDDDEGQPLSA